MFRLDGTDIITPKNAFGALPVQRRTVDEAVKILRRALQGGMTYFDTARSYTDSEEKIGIAFEGVDRKSYYLATKTPSTTREGILSDLETSLKNLKTDYIDVYQLHNAQQCYAPGDGTGVYETMQELKAQGKIRYISITCHKIDVAFKAVESGLYATLQFPLSYLSGEKEIELVKKCKERGVGFIAMKGLAGGLINNARAAYGYLDQFDNVLPIWGVQHMHELEEWLSFMDTPPTLDEELVSLIIKDRESMKGAFCRSCGYCMPCPKGIIINQCARMVLMLGRAPTKKWLSDEWQKEMAKINDCINCGRCKSRCPYGLDVPNLLKQNLEGYNRILQEETNKK